MRTARRSALLATVLLTAMACVVGCSGKGDDAGGPPELLGAWEIDPARLDAVTDYARLPPDQRALARELDAAKLKTWRVEFTPAQVTIRTAETRTFPYRIKSRAGATLVLEDTAANPPVEITARVQGDLLTLTDGAQNIPLRRAPPPVKPAE